MVVNGKQDEVVRNVIAALVAGERVGLVVPTLEQEIAMRQAIIPALTLEEQARLSTCHSRYCAPDMHYVFGPGFPDPLGLIDRHTDPPDGLHH
jgi:hypothetical protein